MTNGTDFKEISTNLSSEPSYNYGKIEDYVTSNLDLCIGAYRLYEISLAGKHVTGIILVPDSSKFSWITLGAGAGINSDALVDPCGQTGSTQAVGCMSGFSSSPTVFVKKYPQLPAAAFKSLDDIKQTFPQDSVLTFYYPTVPNKVRDSNTI